MDHRGAGRRMFLHALVALDATRVVVFRLALLPRELDAVDAAVALVEHRHVIDDAAAEARAARRVRPDPVEVRRYELLVLCKGAKGRRHGQSERSNSSLVHATFLLLWRAG